MRFRCTDSSAIFSASTTTSLLASPLLDVLGPLLPRTFPALSKLRFQDVRTREDKTPPSLVYVCAVCFSVPPSRCCRRQLGVYRRLLRLAPAATPSFRGVCVCAERRALHSSSAATSGLGLYAGFLEPAPSKCTAGATPYAGRRALSRLGNGNFDRRHLRRLSRSPCRSSRLLFACPLRQRSSQPKDSQRCVAGAASRVRSSARPRFVQTARAARVRGCLRIRDSLTAPPVRVFDTRAAGSSRSGRSGSGGLWFSGEAPGVAWFKQQSKQLHWKRAGGDCERRRDSEDPRGGTGGGGLSRAEFFSLPDSELWRSFQRRRFERQRRSLRLGGDGFLRRRPFVLKRVRSFEWRVRQTRRLSEQGPSALRWRGALEKASSAVNALSHSSRHLRLRRHSAQMKEVRRHFVCTRKTLHLHARKRRSNLRDRKESNEAAGLGAFQVRRDGSSCRAPVRWGVLKKIRKRRLKGFLFFSYYFTLGGCPRTAVQIRLLWGAADPCFESIGEVECKVLGYLHAATGRILTAFKLHACWGGRCRRRVEGDPVPLAGFHSGRGFRVSPVSADLHTRTISTRGDSPPGPSGFLFKVSRWIDFSPPFAGCGL